VCFSLSLCFCCDMQLVLVVVISSKKFKTSRFVLMLIL